MKANNTQKMREALERLRDFIEDLNAEQKVIEYGQYSWAIDLIDKALAAPPKEHGRVKRVSLTMYSHKSQTQAHGDIAMTLDDALTRLAKWWGNNGTRLNDFEGIVFEVMDDTASEDEYVERSNR